MKGLRELMMRLGGLFNKQREDIDEEIGEHLEIRTGNDSNGTPRRRSPFNLN